jgi:hypothetical protein
MKSLIQGDFQVSRLGLYTQLAMQLFPKIFLPLNKSNYILIDFLTENNESALKQSPFSVIKISRCLFTGKTDFSNTFFYNG